MHIIRVNGKKEVKKNFQKYLDKKLQYLSNKKGFLGMDNKFNFKENVDAVAFGSKVAALCVETTKNSLGSTSENVRKLEKIVNSQNSSRIVELKPLIAAFP